MRRFVRITLKSLAALFAIITMAFVFCAWWLASQPLDTRNLTPFVEIAFSYIIPQTRTHIEKTTLTWDNHEQTLDLSCKEVKVFDPSGAQVSSFPLMHLKINFWSFLRGRILPLEMSSDEARFWVTRNRAGVLSLGGQSEKKASSGVDFSPILQDMADELANGSLRQKIDIKNALIFIQDDLISKNITLHVPEISLHHDADISMGEAKIELVQKGRPIYLKASYNFKEKHHHLGLSFQDIRPAALAQEDFNLKVLELIDFPLSGKISIITDKTLKVVDADIKIEGAAGKLAQIDLWDEPRSVQKASIKGGFDREKNSWVLRQAEIDFDGPKLFLEAEVKAPLKKSELWRYPRQDYAYWVKLTLQDLPMDRFAAFWPKIAIPKPRVWIAAHMSKGIFTKGDITLRGQIDWDDLTQCTLDTGEGQIKARGGQVNYMDGMKPIEDVEAVARYTLSKMDVDILGGHSGNVVLKPFTINMTDFAKDMQRIVIPVKLTGPTHEIIQSLKGPPLGYADKLGLEPEDMGGTLDGTLTLRMPLLAELLLKDIDIEAKAKIMNFSSQKLVPDFPLSEGKLNFDLGKDGFSLEGPISIRHIPLNLSWKTSFDNNVNIKEPLHQAVLVGSVSGKAWAASELLKKVRYEGVMPLTLHYVQTEDGFSTIDSEANLQQAEVTVDYLGWKKPKGDSAKISLSFDLLTGENIKITKIDLQGKNLNVQGQAELDKTTKDFVTLNLSPFLLGRSKAEVSIKSPSEVGAPIEVDVLGASFDISGLMSERKSGEPDLSARKYHVKTDKLYTSEKGFLTEAVFTAQHDNKGWDELLLKGKSQGDVPFDFSLIKKDKIRTLSITSDDFGLALKGAGLSDGVRGGKLVVTGESSVQEPRVVRGQIKVGSFKVSDAPLLARLFSAISPFGFADLITGDSSFDRMKGRFSWWGEELDIRDLRAIGSVAGINLEGRINLGTGEANLNGTLVPFSFFNSIIGAIPLLGEVITGGEGQGVIAASFKIKGPLSEADISVNPVSLLAPGFLRNLFFTSETKEKEAK